MLAQTEGVGTQSSVSSEPAYMTHLSTTKKNILGNKGATDKGGNLKLLLPRRHVSGSRDVGEGDSFADKTARNGGNLEVEEFASGGTYLPLPEAVWREDV